MKRKQYILLKDMPGCPAGRIFKEDINGNYYHSMSDEDFMRYSFATYSLHNKFVENNPEWFQLQEE